MWSERIYNIFIGGFLTEVASKNLATGKKVKPRFHDPKMSESHMKERKKKEGMRPEKEKRLSGTLIIFTLPRGSF